MKKFLLGGALGSIGTFVCLVFLGGLLTLATQSKLVETWRKLTPGMTSTDVVVLCGTPTHEFATAQDAPDWALESVTNEYAA